MTSPRIEIPQFPGNKYTALTFSFDDGVATDRPVIEKFNEWGLKATFNLNSGAFGGRHYSGNCPYVQASEVAALYAGHEVALHTVTHPFLERLDPAHVAQEVLEDKAALEDLVGYPVRGMAYPFGTYDERVIAVLRALGIVYCRTVETAERCFPPAEPLAWATTCHQYDAGLPKKWEGFLANTYRPSLCYIWGHTYEFHVNNDWAAVERIFKPLAGRPEVWYCTNIELFDYQAARLRLVFGANRKIVHNPSSLAVSILMNNKLVEVAGGATVLLMP